MSNFSTYQTGEESPPSSDDKMDTSSDTLHSQDTPYSDSDDPDLRNPQVLRLTTPQDINSTLSSDSDDLENPTQNSKLRNGTNYEPQEPNTVLRLSEPSVQLATKMSTLYLDSPDRVTVPEKIQNTSTPKLSSTLTLTTSHPLMGLGSPVYPDLIPKKVHKSEDDKEEPLSSVEDEKIYRLYSPERNTSKNNLYFTENFVTAESILTDDIELAPDVARLTGRRRIVPKIDTPQRNLCRNLDGSKIDCAMKDSSQSTPEFLLDETEYHSGVAEWADPPSQLRSNPNFELPIEMSSSIGIHNDLDSPDVVSSSTLEEKSLYAAMLDPSTGGVLLRHTPRSAQPPRDTRRKIQLPVEEDRSSLDSLSDATLESEDEPIDDDVENRTCDNNCEQCSDDDDSKHSKSTNTVSHSDTIPEYSAAEELTADRAWLTVGAENRRLCDMKVIEPYKRVVSHGGYSGGLALVVFSACYLPDNSRADYHYVMDNLFLYVIYTLERLVTDEYILIYLHGSPRRRRLPTLHWLHECYKLIDRRLRKSLKHLYVVHPTIWLRSFVILTKPFISSKFFRKLSYVKTLDQLMNLVPVEPNAIPELVKEFDSKLKR